MDNHRVFKILFASDLANRSHARIDEHEKPHDTRVDPASCVSSGISSQVDRLHDLL